MFESRDPQVSELPSYPQLLGDIGGTNARLAWLADAHSPISHTLVLPCAEHELSLIHI